MKSTTLMRKVQFTILVPLLIMGAGLLYFLYISIQDFVVDEVKNGLKGQTEIIYRPMFDKYNLHKIGVIKEKSLSVSEAIKIIKEVRFGDNGKNYFWLIIFVYFIL